MKKSLLLAMAALTTLLVAGQSLDDSWRPVISKAPAAKAVAQSPTARLRPSKVPDPWITREPDGIHVHWQQSETWTNKDSIPDTCQILYIITDVKKKITYDTIVNGNEWVDPRDPYTMTPPDYATYGVAAWYQGDCWGEPNNGIQPIQLGYFTTPLNFDFANYDKNALWMFRNIDVAGDNMKWNATAGATQTGGASHTYLYISTSTKAKDDWLISAPVALKAGMVYTYRTRMTCMSNGKEETFEVKIGRGDSIAAMTQTLIEPSTVNELKVPKDFTTTFTVAEDGWYYIGMHAMTPTGQGQLAWEGMWIDKGFKPGTPAMPTNLTAEPDTNLGTTHVTLKFNLPTRTVDGDTLETVPDYTILCDGDLIRWIREGGKPGEAKTFMDASEMPGYHTWTVFCSNGKGDGAEASVTMYAGVNIAQNPTNIVAAPASDGLSAVVGWDVPTADIAGWPVKSKFITYNVYEVHNFDRRLVAEKVTANRVTVPVIADPSDTRVVRYEVKAVTQAGESGSDISRSIAVGAAQSLPWTESFERANFDSNGCIEPGLVGTTFGLDRNISNVKAADGDDGYVMLYCPKVSSHGVATPALRIEGTNPTATIYGGGNGAGCANPLGVEVNDGSGWKEVGKTAVNTVSSAMDAPGALRFSLADYIGKTVRVRFTAGITHTTVFTFDNLIIGERAERNLAVARITGNNPTGRLLAGQNNTIRVQVRNIGEKASPNLITSVTLSRDGKDIGTAKLTAIEPDRAQWAEFTDLLPATVGDKASYTARVSWDGYDMYEADNTMTQAFEVQRTSMPSGFGLEGCTTAGDVALTWNAPDTEGVDGEPLFDDFESYPAWTYGAIGDWTTFACAGSPNGGILTANIPLYNQLTGWFILDQTVPGYINDTYEWWGAWSGNMCLTSNTPRMGAPDDWAVTPRLSGRAQDITFRHTSRRLQAWVSYTGKEKADFTLLEAVPDIYHASGDKNNLFTMPYRAYTIHVPEGAQYVAFRNLQDNDQFTNIDDVSLMPARKTPLQLKGYNVYRDGQKLNDVLVTKPRYIDPAAPAGNHDYFVTAVYDDGAESSPSEVLTLDPAGVGAITSDTAIEVARYAPDGREADASYRGVVIVKYSDGSVRKMVNVK